jgi:hypothetical protein
MRQRCFNPGVATLIRVSVPNLRNRFPARRRFLKQSAALTAGASLIGLPADGRAAPAPSRGASTDSQPADSRLRRRGKSGQP